MRESSTGALVAGTGFLEGIKVGAAASDLLSHFTVRAVASSPIAVDADFDYMSDAEEFASSLDPGNPDTDRDGEVDGFDPDPSVIDPYGPTVAVSDILVEFGLSDIKTYHVTFSICDPLGVTAVQVQKNDQVLRSYELPRSKKCLEFYARLSINLAEGLVWGANFFVFAVDETGSLTVMSLRQPTLLTDVVEVWMKELTKHFAGPAAGGILNGIYYAFKDTFVDMVDLITNFPKVLEALVKVGSEFGKDPTGTAWTILLQMLSYLDTTQWTANPYANGTNDHEMFRFSWYLGYVAGGMLLAWTGSHIARGVLGSFRVHRAFHAADVFDAATDAGSLTRKVGLWARFSPTTRFMLVAGSVTAGFALASYVWPELFQSAFSQYMSAAFPAFVLGSMVSPGGLDGPSSVRRMRSLVDGYHAGAIPGPRFFRVVGGLDGGDALLGSVAIGRRAWAYIRAANVDDVFDPGLGANRVHRFVHAPQRTLVAPDGTRIPDVVVLLEGDLQSGWVHIGARHIRGTYDPGSGRWTLFPSELTDPQVQALIAEVVAGDANPLHQANGRWLYTHNLNGRNGINTMQVVVNADGTIRSAWPVDGPRVVVLRP